MDDGNAEKPGTGSDAKPAKRPWRTPEAVRIHLPDATRANGNQFLDGFFAGDLS